MSSRYNPRPPAVVAVREAGPADPAPGDDRGSAEPGGRSHSERAEKPVGVAVLGTGQCRAARSCASSRTCRRPRRPVGAPLVLRGVGVRRVAADRGVPIDMLTDDVDAWCRRDDVDIVVEVMAAVDRRARRSCPRWSGQVGGDANKALMSVHRRARRRLPKAPCGPVFRGGRGGCHPGDRPLTQSLAGDTVHRVAGIVNGTTNYILSAMDKHRRRLREALADASALGYAEADPTADVEGYDAAAKAAILASIAFHTRVTADDVYREGITKITPADFASAGPWAARSSCWRSVSASPSTMGSSGFRRGSIRRWCRCRIRLLRSAARSTRWWSRPRPRAD